MTKDQYRNKLTVRLRKRLKDQSFDEISAGGSRMRFDMSMAIDGYPFELPPGADPKQYSPLLTHEQYMSGQYDDITNEIFHAAANGAFK